MRRRCTRDRKLLTGTQELRRLPQLQRACRRSLRSSVLVTVASGSVRGAPLYSWAMQAALAQRDRPCNQTRV